MKAPKRISVAKLARDGLRVAIKADEPVALGATLLSTGFGNKRHPGDREARPRSVRLGKLGLGKARIEMNQSEAEKVTLKLGPKAKKKLLARAKKGEPLPARLIVTGVDGNGNRTAEAVRLTITAG